MNPPESQHEGIAIIGMAGRFPGARNIAEFWQNLVTGAETITQLTDAQLSTAGLDPASVRAEPGYVAARGMIERPEWFDATFFGITPKEAEVMDPQQRVFLEEAWTALEDAGCDPARYAGAIGVFAGMSNNTYFANNVASRADLIAAVGQLTAMVGNEKDYLATRVAYKLDLRGPAISVYTACSTSLVAVCQACTALLTYQCDTALAGGVSITFPQERGYQWAEGGITSSDGHCRAFDAAATGTVFSSGTGIVVLKRLADALADGDRVYAVIKGSALNNDGAKKLSFTAPSVDGHAEVIALAQALAGFAPETISYIEAHGTGTQLGDPIEIAGLTQAFRAGTDAKNFCAIGSVKTNIGHVDVASGVVGLIKTALALQHRVLPASLHFHAPNPKLDLENSPFRVNTATRDWEPGSTPRRAGVSSFGLGGTNAHVVLEECEPVLRSQPSQPALIVLSARSLRALEDATTQLGHFLQGHPDLPIEDVAFTLQHGRRAFGFRRFVVAASSAEAGRWLLRRDRRRVFTTLPTGAPPPSGSAEPLTALGHRWLAGEEIDWTAHASGGPRRKVSLPTYPFERQRYWAEPRRVSAESGTRDALPPTPAGGDAYASLSRSERLLAEVLEELQNCSGMDLRHADPSASFTELGFDSLFLTQASLALQKRFGVPITRRRLLEDMPTPRDLAAWLDGKITQEPEPAAHAGPAPESFSETVQEVAHATGRRPGAAAFQPPQSTPAPLSAAGKPPLPVSILPADLFHSLSGPEFPLTDAQMELLLATQMGPEASASFNESVTIHLRGALDAAALGAAFSQLVARHEAFRTTFAEDGQTQRVAPSLAVSLPLTDLSALGADAQARAFTELLATETTSPFDLQRGPLLRAALVKLAEDRHDLVLTMHHIVCDGWSFNLAATDLAALYSARPLAAPRAFREYARWLHGKQTGPDFAATEDFWLRQFSDLPPALELPTDHPRGSRRSYRGARCTTMLPRELHDGLKRFSAKQRCTLFTTMLAAFQVLLHRLTGQDDLVTGIPAAGQAAMGGEDVIGHCVNFLPIRARMAGDPDFTSFLATMRTPLFEAFDHQNLTFGALLQKLALPRDASRMPLLGATFNIDPGGAKLDFAGLVAEVEVNPKLSLSLELSFYLIETARGPQLSCAFNRDLFEPETIDRWLAHYLTLLGGIVADAARPLSQLPLLTPDERRRLLVEWNDTAVDFPQDKTLHQLFEEQAARTPDAVAVACGDGKITYAELDQRAGHIADHLRSLGVGPDVLVGVCMERSAEMVVALLGVLKAGGAYVPMDPGYPRERLAHMIADARMPVVLTQSALLDRLPADTVRVACLDREWKTSPVEEPREMPVKVTAGHPAYVLFTSGSTGLPKGAIIPHRAICNHMFWMQRAFPLTADDRVFQKTPFFFDASVWEFYAPLLAGGLLVMAQPDGHRDGAYLVRTIAERGITILQLVPSQLQMILAESALGGCSSLKRVFCGGEVLTPELQAAFYKRHPTASLHNLYGPTEAAIDSTVWTCPRDWGRRPVPIGRPIDNARTYIVDAHSQPVPVGVPGELLIAGVGLARGYLHRPELTAEKFVRDPFDSSSGGLLYRTGDLARYLADGNIEYLGRIDHQVKIRGFRIELGEIESVLAAHPAIREAVVIARREEEGENRLIAYAVATGETPALAELRAHLQTRLPDYMIPAAFVFLGRFPLTNNGKIDRRALPDPDPARMTHDTDFVPPRNEAEERVAEVWRHVLKLDRIGVNDDFFHLGGHSLAAMQVVSRLRGPQYPDVNVLQIFERPTIAGFVETLHAASGAAAREEGVL